MTDPLNRLATHLVELTVYAPIGAVALVHDRLPELVAEGRQRVHQRVTVARFIGQMVVAQGRREIERRLAPDQAPEAPSDDDGADGLQPAPRPQPAATTSLRPDPGAVPAVTSLPVADYESLAASQVVARLAALEPADLDAVEAFERAHRNRRTVLNRIAQLRTRS